MKELNVTKWICGVLCLLGFVFPVADASADVVSNYFYDLDDTAAPIEPPTGWSLRAGSGGARNGTTITAPAGGDQFYVYSAGAPNDITVDNNEAWMVEAVLSGTGLGGAGESGARMWVTFKDPALFMLPPPATDKYRRAEVRLLEDGTGARRVVLWSKFTAGNPAGEEVLSLDVDWARQPPGNHRYRIRLKRQRIDTGTVEDYIILQAEACRRPSPSDALWWDDPESPWADSVPAGPDADPPHRYSQRILVSDLDFNTAGTSEIGFGHTNNGAAGDTSGWESIFACGTDETDNALVTTVLPYWPPEPPAPLVTLTTAVPPHEVISQVDLPVGAYLVNDAATLVLDTLSGELSSAPIPDPSAPPAQHIETFTGLAGDQTVTGWVEIDDVSGRTSTGPSTSVDLPPTQGDPEIEVSPLEHDFGDVEIGTSVSTIITITNVGTVPLTINDIGLQGGSSPDFSVTNAPALPVVLASEASADVEVTYTPTVTGYAAAVLEIASDDPDGNKEVLLGGVGVDVEPPIVSIEEILEFFDESVANGTLEGRGHNPKMKRIRLKAMRHMLIAAGTLIDGDYIGWACFTLGSAERRSDGMPRPRDLVVGVAVPELNGMIQQLRDNLGCT